MHHGPGRQPAEPAQPGGARVQPAGHALDELHQDDVDQDQPDHDQLDPDEVDRPDPLLLRWLEEHERDEEAERLERLLADRDLVTRLEYSGYADKEWEPVATEFARYGMSVLTSWIGRGTIFGKLREKRLGGLPEAPPTWFDEQAVSDLATDTVVAALRWFKTNVLMKHRWNPERPGGAASLKSFFIGQTLFQFRDVYRRWHRAERDRREHVIAADPADEELHRATAERVDQVVAHRAEAAEALEQVNGEHVRKAFVMHAAGLTHAEIAAELRLPDEKAVENAMGWQRRRLRRRTEGAA
jgi:hypothetical protein